MPNQNDFLLGYRTLAECEFNDSAEARASKAIIDEMKFTSIMNAEAAVMEANGLFEHKAYRDNELDTGAENVAFEEGYAVSGLTHDEMFSVQMGRIIESKEFNSNQTRFNKAAEAERRARDLKKATDALNRKDARTLVYGGTEAFRGRPTDLKEYDGVASFTSKLTDLSDFWTAIDNDLCPFTHAHQCITIDAQQFKTSNAKTAVDEKLGSIFAIVWGSDYASKLYPLGDSVSYGINVTTKYGDTCDYIDNVTGKQRHYYRDLVDMEKFSGLWVGNRYGIIRIANINMDPSQTEEEWNATLTSVEAAAAEAMRIQDYAGVTAMANWYTNGALISKFKQLRAHNQVYVAGVSAQGQPQNIGMQVPFMLLDSVALKNELTMVTTEKFVV